MTTEDEIREAEARQKSAAAAAIEAKKHLDALYIRRSTETYGIKVGMRVRSRGSEFIVDEIKAYSWNNKPWLRGRKIKNDGTPGARRQHIYSDWEIVT